MSRRPLLSRLLLHRRDAQGRRRINPGPYLLVVLLLIVVVCWRLLTYAPPSSGPSVGRSVTSVPTAPAIDRQTPAPALQIADNQLVDSANRVVRLTGANRSGTEYRCLHYSVFDGPNNQASIDAMLSWRINAIRIPLNEDCWLSVNMKDSPFAGDFYREHIANYVQLLISNGITPILDLHWTAPGDQQAVGQEPMPDRDHSILFWKQVARAYKGNNAVIFDLFNEPYPDNNNDTITAWNCWKYGTNPLYCPAGTAGLNYNAAGMQDLVNAVRGTGATNVIMLGGIQYAATLDGWMEYAPVDPAHELAASWHLYNFSQCSLRPCWGSQGMPVMHHYLVITGEIGENDQGSAFLTRLMNFLDNPGNGLPPQSYLAWTWNTDQTVFDLITNYSGEPTTPYGLVYKRHLMAMHLCHALIFSFLGSYNGSFVTVAP